MPTDDTADTRYVEQRVRTLWNDPGINLIHTTRDNHNPNITHFTTEDHHHGTHAASGDTDGIMWTPTTQGHASICDVLFPGWRET